MEQKRDIAFIFKINQENRDTIPQKNINFFRDSEKLCSSNELKKAMKNSELKEGDFLIRESSGYGYLTLEIFKCHSEENYIWKVPKRFGLFKNKLNQETSWELYDKFTIENLNKNYERITDQKIIDQNTPKILEKIKFLYSKIDLKNQILPPEKGPSSSNNYYL